MSRLADDKTDEQLVELAGPYSQAELTRRLKVALESHQSALATQQEVSNRLTKRIEVLTQRLLWFTIALFAVGIVQIIATALPLALQWCAGR